MPILESIHDMPPAPLPEPQPVTHECLECMVLLTEAQVYQVGGLLKHICIGEWASYEICGPCVNIMAGAVVPDAQVGVSVSAAGTSPVGQPPTTYREAAQAAFARER